AGLGAGLLAGPRYSGASRTPSRVRSRRGPNNFHERNRAMDKRTLGPDGPEVSEIGLGCMGMSAFYGSADEGEARATIERALDLGCNFLDTSDMYGPYTNERLVGSAISDRRR